MPTAVDIYTAVRRFETAYASAMRPLAEQLSMAQPAVDILLFLANNPGRDTARDICTYRKLKPAIDPFMWTSWRGRGIFSGRQCRETGGNADWCRRRRPRWSSRRDGHFRSAFHGSLSGD